MRIRKSPADFFDIIRSEGDSLGDHMNWSVNPDGSLKKICTDDGGNEIIIRGNCLMNHIMFDNERLCTKKKDNLLFCYNVDLELDDRRSIRISDKLLRLLDIHITRKREVLGDHSLWEFRQFAEKYTSAHTADFYLKLSNTDIEKHFGIKIKTHALRSWFLDKVYLVETFEKPFCRSFHIDGNYVAVEKYKQTLKDKAICAWTDNLKIRIDRNNFVISQPIPIYRNSSPLDYFTMLSEDLVAVFQFLDETKNVLNLKYTNRELLKIYEFLYFNGFYDKTF